MYFTVRFLLIVVGIILFLRDLILQGYYLWEQATFSIPAWSFLPEHMPAIGRIFIIVFDVIVLVFLVGLWYRKQWAVWGMSIAIGFVHILAFVGSPLSLGRVFMWFFSLIVSMAGVLWLAFAPLDIHD